MQISTQLSELGRLKQELRPHLSAIGAAFGALAGAGTYFYLPFDPWWGWGLVVLGLGLIGWGLAWRKAAVAMAIALVMAGSAYVLSAWQVERVEVIDYAAASKTHWLVGRVVEIVEKADKPNRATVRMEDVETFGLGREGVEKASIGVYRSQIKDVRVGDALAMPVVLMSPEGPKFKGQRDGRVWRYFADNRVNGYVLGTVEPTFRNQEPGSRNQVERWMKWVEVQRLRIYEDSKDLAGGAVAALLVGEERGITREVRDAYRNTGLAHLLAISGMQMTIVALGIFWLLRWAGALVPWVALRVDIRLWAAVGALVGTVFYTFLAGASVSLVRASVMAGIVMIAVITGRMKSALRAWCIAAILVVMVNPVMVTRAGFQLSLVAVLALILLAVAEQGRWKGGSFTSWARGLVLATVVAGAATAPVGVAHFGQFAVVGMLANLVAVPVMALATYVGMVALVLWPFGAATPVLGLMGVIVGWVNAWAVWMAGLGFASIQVDRNLWWVVAVFAVIIVASVLVRRWAEAAVATVSVTVILIIVAAHAQIPEVRIWDDGRVGIAKIDGQETLLWADDVEDAAKFADMAQVELKISKDVPQTVDERYMPVTEHEHFAWAERTGGKWHVEPVACGRIWQKVTEGCW